MTSAQRIQQFSPRQRALLVERLQRLEGETDAGAAKQLVAYVVCRKGRTVQASELRTFLQPRLPEFMVPSSFVFLESLPVQPNGKLDRRVLPPPPPAATPETGFVGPRNEIETRIAEIWRALLRADRVGVHDNFFRLGGHSLLALQVMARVRNAFGADLPLRTLFEFPTVAGLAEAVGRTPKENRGGPIQKVARPNPAELLDQLDAPPQTRWEESPRRGQTDGL